MNFISHKKAQSVLFPAILLSAISMTPAYAQDASGTTDKKTETAVEGAGANKETQATIPEWTFQLRGGLGVGRVLSQKAVKTDRLAAGVFAGKRFSELRLSLPFLNIEAPSLGCSYQSFTGVDSVADKTWSMQSMGAQATLLLNPFRNSMFDLSVSGGLNVQRLVSQEPLNRQESASYGVGLSGGAYARVLALDGVHVLGGAELVTGSATWLGISAGVESNF